MFFTGRSLNSLDTGKLTLNRPVWNRREVTGYVERITDPEEGISGAGEENPGAAAGRKRPYYRRTGRCAAPYPAPVPECPVDKNDGLFN